MNSFYSREELRELGFRHLGSNVKISRKSSIYNAVNMEIGNNVRIDDFCILSGFIKLDNFIHIAAFSSLYGGTEGIRMMDYSTISSRVAIYALSDDYSGNFMTNPTIPEKYTNVYSKRVILGKHVIVGTGSTILPGVDIKEGAAVGAMSLVIKDLKEWGIYVGTPVIFLRSREQSLLKLEQKYTDSFKR